MLNNFNKLIIALSLFDTTYLLVSLVYIFTNGTEAQDLMYPYFLGPGALFASRASIFMTVAIACQRFLAVRHPFKYGRNNRRYVKIYMASVFALALVTAIPTFFEYTVKYANFQEDDDNATNETVPYLSPTSMKESIGYKVYETFGDLVIFGIIPFALLIYFYNGIYKEIKASNSRTGGLASNASEGNKKKEETLAKTFTAFVLSFFICYTPQHIYRIYQIILLKQTTRCSELPFPVSEGYALEITQMLIVLNSAINVVIYSAVNHQFRNECKEIIRRLIPSSTQQGGVQGLSSGGMTTVGQSNDPVTKTTDAESIQMSHKNMS